MKRLVRLRVAGFAFWALLILVFAHPAAAQCTAQDQCCGNNICDPDERESCPEDCHIPVCGDGVCRFGETAESCPDDCGAGPICGNLVCESGENSSNCGTDCPGVCEPQGCDGRCGAVSDGCSATLDCGSCGGGSCGDQVCDQGEESSCPSDCSCTPTTCDNRCGQVGDGCGGTLDCGACGGQCNNDGVCDTGAGENASNCSPDCGVSGTCGNHTVDPGETCSNCLSDVGGHPRFTISTTSPRPGEVVTLTADLSVALADPVPLWDVGNGDHLSGVQITYSWPAEGTFNVVLTASESSCLTTQVSSPTAVHVSYGGGPACNNNGTCEAGLGENASNCGDCVQCQPTGCNGRCGTVGDGCGGALYCGACSGGCNYNGFCEHGEDASSCADDCGDTNGGECGNHVCEADETSQGCPQDCGGPSCGNGVIDAGETCFNCAPDVATRPRFTISDPSPRVGDHVLLSADLSIVLGTPTPLWDLGNGDHLEGVTLDYLWNVPGTYQVVLNRK